MSKIIFSVLILTVLSSSLCNFMQAEDQKINPEDFLTFLRGANSGFGFFTGLHYESDCKTIDTKTLDLAREIFNDIKTIENVAKNKYLKVLILHHNQISKIHNLEENRYLENLDLSFNNIEIVEGLDWLPLQKLNMMGNKIRNITGLENLNLLLDLNLSRNFITKLKGLQRLTNLRYLYISSNNISRAKQVAYITELPFLTDVDFCYNEVQNRKFYRYQV